MSVLIKGMEMPKCCDDCDLCFELLGWYHCQVMSKTIAKSDISVEDSSVMYKRQDWCPLSEQPAPYREEGEKR